MKINFGKLIQDSWEFTWKYKILWIFGLLLSIFSSSGSINNNSSNGVDSENNMKFFDSNTFTELSKTPNFWLIIVFIIVVGISLALIGWYLSAVSKSAIIRGVKMDNDGNGNEIRFKKMFGIGNSLALKVMLQDLVWLGFGILVAIVIGIPVTLITFVLGPFAICLFCIFIILAIPLMLLFWAVFSTSQNLLIYYDMEVIESIQASWDLVLREWKNVLIAQLIQIGISIGIFAIYFTFALIIVIPLSVLLTLAYAGSQANIGIVALGFILIVIAVLVIAIVSAPITVFTNVYWTKLVNQLKG